MENSFNSKILVAEENELIRVGLSKSLANLGYEVVECSTGQEALRLLTSSDRPAMAFIGWQMPGMTALEICRSVRGESHGKSLYLILLMSKNQKELLLAGLESGANDYLLIPVEQGELVARVITGTRLVQLELLLEEREAKMIYSSKMESLGQMAAGIAHEINNPLAIISGGIEQILRVVLQPHANLDLVRERCEKLKNTVKRITKIIFGLRTFAGESGVQEQEVVETKSLIEDALSLCEGKLKNSGIQMRTPSEGLDSFVLCNRVQVCQVMVNLLNNSFLSIKEFPEPWVEINVQDREDTVEFLLTDSGGGIPKAIRDKVMKPFFTTRVAGQGTGLGLSISKGIIEAHGGKLWLDEACPNTRFVFSLPRKTHEVDDQPILKAS